MLGIKITVISTHVNAFGGWCTAHLLTVTPALKREVLVRQLALELAEKARLEALYGERIQDAGFYYPRAVANCAA